MAQRFKEEEIVNILTQAGQLGNVQDVLRKILRGRPGVIRRCQNAAIENKKF
jgi:ribosomal protein S28E/S33